MPFWEWKDRSSLSDQVHFVHGNEIGTATFGLGLKLEVGQLELGTKATPRTENQYPSKVE